MIAQPWPRRRPEGSNGARSAEDEKGYGIRGMNLLRRGTTKSGTPAIHLLDTVCRSHRLVVRSSYGAELLAASHGVDDAYPTMITMVELRDGILDRKTLRDYRERGKLPIKVDLTVDAESVFKSLISRDLKTPAEKTLLGHVCWLRECLQLGIIHCVQ